MNVKARNLRAAALVVLAALAPLVAVSASGAPESGWFAVEPGDVVAANLQDGSVAAFDGRTGAFLGAFVDGGELGGPFSLVFGPDGDLFVSSAATFSVLRFDGTTGGLANTVTVLPDRGVPVGLAFAPDGRLYVSDFGRNRLFVIEPGSSEPRLLATEGLAGPENTAVVPAPATR